MLEPATEAAATSPECFSFGECDRLRQPLCSLTGMTSYRALLSRALTLTKVEFPRLAPALVSESGGLGSLEDIEPPLSREEAAQGEVILLAHMVELLCTLIGETLALRLVQGVWPEATLADQDLGKEETHE